MNFAETNAYRVRAAHCAHQAELADDWLALDGTILAVENARLRSSFSRQKLVNCA